MLLAEDGYSHGALYMFCSHHRFSPKGPPVSTVHVLVTAGPTREAKNKPSTHTAELNQRTGQRSLVNLPPQAARPKQRAWPASRGAELPSIRTRKLLRVRKVYLGVPRTMTASPVPHNLRECLRRDRAGRGHRSKLTVIKVYFKGPFHNVTGDGLALHRCATKGSGWR